MLVFVTKTQDRNPTKYLWRGCFSPPFPSLFPLFLPPQSSPSNTAEGFWGAQGTSGDCKCHISIKRNTKIGANVVVSESTTLCFRKKCGVELSATTSSTVNRF